MTRFFLWRIFVLYGWREALRESRWIIRREAENSQASADA